MLFNIVNPDNFKECLKNVEKAFYCLKEQEYEQYEKVEKWDGFTPPVNLLICNFEELDSADTKEKKITEAIDEFKKLDSDEAKEKKIAKAIDENEKLYKVIADDNKVVDSLSMPYLDSYHELFLKRDYKSKTKSIFSIDSSKNKGNYYHFINVVAALARLIIYFQKPKNVDSVFAANSDGLLKLHEHDRGLLVYDKIPSMRTFKLMLAGFYHDLGKTITDPRHPMEGAIVLAYHTTQKRLKLDKIAKKYNKIFEFERDDLLFIADLVLFHDQYGTLSTGEDGYIALVNAIDRIKRYSLKPDLEKEDIGIQSFERCKKHIFDLWLLNVADIMVSRARKGEKQTEWDKEDEANAKIVDFFMDEKGVRLRHDFEITFDLLRKQTKDGESGHSDDLSTLESEAYNWSKKHSIERLRRLVTELLTAPNPIGDIRQKITKLLEPSETTKDIQQQKSDLKQETLDELTRKGLTHVMMIIDELLRLPESHWNLLLIRSIQSVADFDDFTTRLSWIGKMDYALGFFQKILRQALYQIVCEIIMLEKGDIKIVETLFGKAPKELKRTGWIRDLGIADLEKEGSTQPFYCKTQAVFFADNFVATMIQILEHLLFRERAIDRLRNIEFSDTRDRLTEDKLNQVLSLEGPYRTRRSIQAILQTIYLY